MFLNLMRKAVNSVRHEKQENGTVKKLTLDELRTALDADMEHHHMVLLLSLPSVPRRSRKSTISPISYRIWHSRQELRRSS